MTDRLRQVAPVALGLILFAASLFVLERELGQIRYADVAATLHALSDWRLPGALLLTAASYLVLTGYDQLALAYAGVTLPRSRVVLASFVAYAITNNVGFAMLSGTSVRYRFYTRWGVTASQLSRIILLYSTTFGLGLLVLGGWTLAIQGPPGLEILRGPSGRALGLVLLLAALAYALAPLIRSRPIRLWRFEVQVPEGRIVAAQFALSALDWTVAACVLYVLLPASGLPFTALLSAFLIAQVVGLVSHVPGGVGVFESVMILLLKNHLGAAALLSSLVLYRIVYYVLPLTVALAILVVDELGQRRAGLRRFGAMFGALSQEITPRVLAVFTFLAGALLLFSGATPATPDRLAWLARVLPLPVLEVSHFVGSVVGVGLLLLSHGVARRLDAAYYLAVGGLLVGLVASLLKGADWEEAIVLAIVLAALLPSRRWFDRRASFFAARFSPDWLALVLATLAASFWLLLFVYRHVEYAQDLWWQVELDRDVSRSLRASLGTALAVLVFAVGRLLRPPSPEMEVPTEGDLQDAGRIIATQTSTAPHLVYLRDKTMLFDGAREGFVMYGVQGRTWVALGDPVGPEAVAPALVRDFLERCDDFDGRPVFYQVSKDRLHHYADQGLIFVKLGEEARVPLTEFSLAGHERKPLRVAQNRLLKDGGAFRVAPPAESAALLDRLQEVSDEWLRHKETAEKGFSLGFFDREYLARWPCALVERGPVVEAFANLWPGPGRDELSIDLMRYRRSAPRGVMDALLVELLLWGKAQGYRWFNLGMAPLSGLETSPVAPLWARLGQAVYRHGEGVYNFQGLRAYKEKFAPVWEPRYLAYPGGLSLPRILADVGALIAGGYRRIFFK